mmetsp:Transcript_12355/g.30414  ORF Transcript_12355/g.30414 Transcript_12355/m.30414 type:complete len:86 (-) Transcript_12355:238-495(-)
MLQERLQKVYPNKFVVRANQPDALMKHGQGKWRVGSFEVVREDTGEKLYSKLDTGSHLVTDEVGYTVLRVCSDCLIFLSLSSFNF